VKSNGRKGADEKMTRLEVIKLIGDVLTRIDVLRGSLSPDDPDRKELDSIRKDLDRKQLQLSKNQFDDNTQAFIKATGQLEAINDDLKQTIKSINKVAETLANLKRFVAAVDGIVGTVLPVV
jgi:methyl-accepting chemotaxis protein